MVVTVEATLLSFGTALVIGMALVSGRRSPNRLFRFGSIAIISFVRNTPVLVQLYFLFYVLPRYGVVLPALLIGVLGLGLHFSTYMSEVYRAGIESVPRQQWDAATALNLSRGRTFVAVILPQALPPMIPALGNYLIIMFKDVAILSTITVVEMFATAEAIATQTFRYLESLTLVGLIYLAVSYPSSLLIRRLERRFRPAHVA
jgi:polar amino acid transport system permease protein